MRHHNMGTIERIIRVLFGALVTLIGGVYLDAFGTVWNPFTGWLSLTSPSVTGVVIFLIGITIFITGWAAYCPVNTLLRVNSCEACRVGETHAHLPV